MKRRAYISPSIVVLAVHAENDVMLLTGSGTPTETSDGISYDGVGGSFDSDESVASRHSVWDD